MISQAESPRYEPDRRSRRVIGPLFGLACLLATLSGVVVLAILLGSVVAAVYRSSTDGSILSTLGHLMSSLRSNNPAKAGYRVGIAGTLWLLGLVTAIAIPAGVGAAVFLEEYAPAGRLRRLIQLNIANLAGVPSIVYGLLGLAVFYRAFGFRSFAMGPTLLVGGLTLSLLILPVIVIATQEALRTVPLSLRQAAMALGASRWQVVRDHVLPSALPGILTGVILALSRAIGETAPLLMVGAVGSILSLPKGPSSRYTALPVEIYNYAKEPAVAFQGVAAGGILLLLALLLTMNATAIIIRNRSARSSRG
ncbi:phosphate ABC transporter permease PstA [Tundrisphaera lichenicola]|uniref:phosphate ABC transporter permease PstA n=1 Tax=Tundrisphaera lichenicola TaxID=2029860 RepID=UPI003EB7BAC2